MTTTFTVPATTSHPPPAAVMVAARTVDAVKLYGRGDAEVWALDGVSVEFAMGRFTAIMGPSGSGKSTLMHAIVDEMHHPMAEAVIDRMKRFGR